MRMFHLDFSHTFSVKKRPQEKPICVYFERVTAKRVYFQTLHLHLDVLLI